MRRNKKGVLLPSKDDLRLLEKIPTLKSIANIEIKRIINIDSSNMQPYVWTEISRKIVESYSNYDGFVIIHGTDTMAYTASALSFALRNLNKPIVFTGAQKPLADLASDAPNNLINAVLVATMFVPEVCIVFGSKILRGNRATKISESNLDAFDSPMDRPIGEITLEPKIYKSHKQYKYKKLINKPNFDPRIIVIELIPGLNIPYLLRILKSDFKGIILKAFGPGNVPDSVLPLLRRIRKLNLPVVILSQCQKGMTQMQLYKVGYQAHEFGVISGADMTLEAAATKLMWILSYTNNLNKIKQIFSKSLAGEISFIHKLH